MRTLKLQMNMTIDGYVGDPDGQLDWMLQEVDEKHLNYLQALTQDTDTILLGRKMAAESVPYWENVVKNETSSAAFEYASFFVKTPKIIFSKTLQNFEGENILIESGNLVEAVTLLKSKQGKDIIVYGGASFVSSLIGHRLVDELNLFVHPIALGSGLAIFNDGSKYKLNKSENYSNGIILNQYLPV